MMAAFGDALQKASGNRKVASLASIEYKERTLTVKWKDDGEMVTAEVKNILANRHLLLNESAPKVWQIKLGK